MNRAPWTKEQVDALNTWQATGHVHPFTCANDHPLCRVLVATENGWICKHCDYTQDWAHDFMFSLPPDLPEWFKDPLRPRQNR